MLDILRTYRFPSSHDMLQHITISLRIILFCSLVFCFLSLKNTMDIQGEDFLRLFKEHVPLFLLLSLIARLGDLLWKRLSLLFFHEIIE